MEGKKTNKKKKRTNKRDTLLVLNVQNQYKDIAHMIEKNDEKNTHCIRTDFQPNLIGDEKNILNKAKDDLKCFYF